VLSSKQKADFETMKGKAIDRESLFPRPGGGGGGGGGRPKRPDTE